MIEDLGSLLAACSPPPKPNKLKPEDLSRTRNHAAYLEDDVTASDRGGSRTCRDALPNFFFLGIFRSLGKCFWEMLQACGL